MGKILEPVIVYLRTATFVKNKYIRKFIREEYKKTGFDLTDFYIQGYMSWLDLVDISEAHKHLTNDQFDMLMNIVNPDIYPRILHILGRAIHENLDITLLINFSEFNPDQLSAIAFAMEKGIPTQILKEAIYVNTYSSIKMRIIIDAILNNSEYVSELKEINVPDEILTTIYDCMKKGYEHTPLLNTNLNIRMLEYVLDLLSHGVPTQYVNEFIMYTSRPVIATNIIDEYVEWLKSGFYDFLGIFQSTSINGNLNKIKLYRYCLLHKLSTEYFTPYFSYEQLVQIYLGQLECKNVSLYAEPSIDWSTMRKIRTSIKS